MPTAIELSTSSIRLCQMRDNTLLRLDNFAIPNGGDPIDALMQAPLPRPLGSVRVVLHHADMLQQCLIQPPAPQDRLDRIIRFELMAIVPDMSSVLCNWQIAPIGGVGDLRIMVNLAKRDLVERLQAALKVHGGQLAGLSIPACGMYQAWQVLSNNHNPDVDEVLVDIGGQQSHVAIVRNGELLFTRTHKAGMNEVIDGIASLRNISHEDAQKLASRLSNSAPEDIQQLIRNSASGLASGITSVLRFASAQLKVGPITPSRISLAGRGGQLPQLKETLSERLKCPIGLINPFADLVTPIDSEHIDQQAALPSPWTTVIGAARSKALTLDTLEQVRQERVAYWSSHGVLRAAAVTAVVLMVLALSRQFIAAHSAESRQHTMANSNDGLVTVAEQQMRELETLGELIAEKRRRTHFLHDRLAAGKVAMEVTNAMASLVDPMTQRVQLTGYQLYRSDNQLRMIVNGIAEESSGRRFAAVLDSYRQQLREIYPLITAISDLGSSIDDSNRMRFQWELRINPHGQNQQTPAANTETDSLSGRGSRGSR